MYVKGILAIIEVLIKTAGEQNRRINSDRPKFIHLRCYFNCSFFVDN